MNWKGEGAMTYECMKSEVNRWKLNFLQKKNTRLNWWKGLTQFGSPGYFDFEFGGYTLNASNSSELFFFECAFWSGTVILQTTQTYIRTRISKSNYM